MLAKNRFNLSRRLCVRVGLASFFFLSSAHGLAQNRNLVAQTQTRNRPLAAASADTSEFLSAAEIEEEYAIARSALNSRDWVRALVALEMVLASNPNYRDADKMLVTARRGLEQDSTEARLARSYVEGMKAKRAGDYQRARQELRAVNQEQQNYRDVAAQLAEIERELPPPQTVSNDNVLEVPADSLYALARAAAAQQDWKKAAALYSKLEAADPENLKLRKQAERARVNLLIAQTGLARVEAKGRGWGWLQMAFFIGVILLLALVLLLAFSLQLRVGYFLKHGELRRATQLYESALQRDPKRLKLYPPLADLYVRTQRTDAAAMKIFKALLQSNLFTPHRKAIAAIVAQNANTTSAQDVEALETALRNAREKDAQYKN